MRKIFCSVFLWAMCLQVLIAAPESAILVGTIAKRGRQGIVVANQDFVISNGSRVCFTTADWSKVFLRSVPYPEQPPTQVEAVAGGFRETIAPTAGTGMISLDEYSVLCEGNHAKIAVRASAPTELQEAVVEHVAFVLRAGLLQGAEYEILEENGRISKGIIPMVQLDKSRRGLLPAFRKATFRSALGTVSVEVLEGASVKLDDRRSAIFEGLGPSFIVWSDGNHFDSNGHYVQKLALTFDYPGHGSSQSVSVQGKACAERMREAVPPRDFPLLPLPASLAFNNEEFRPALGMEFSIVGGSALLMGHAQKLVESWGMHLVQGKSGDSVPCVMRVGSAPEDEAYTLAVDRNGIQIDAGGERGGFYALQTLRGLYRNKAFRGVKIQDHPAFAIRAVHAMADSDTLEHLAPFITEVLAPLKINTLILECPFVNWESLEGMHHPKGMPKEDLVKLLKLAHDNYLKVYPLVPTYSHSEWFFQNGHNLEMMDNPSDNTAYNSLHPGVRPFLEKLFTEVLATFGNPEYFHISHDELCRSHPFNPEGRKVGIKNLLKDDILWHYEFFRRRGVKVMLWHDMLVSKNECGPRAVANARGKTEELRKELPKDLTICVWNYDIPRGNDFPEVNAVADDHFPLLGAGWYTEGNLEALTKNCLARHALGMIVTTWHWKFDSAGVLYTQYGQMHSYVRAASLFWNPKNGCGDEAPKVLVNLLAKPETTLGRLTAIPLTGNTMVSEEAPEFAALTGDEVKTDDGLFYRLLRDADGQLATVCVKSRRLPHLSEKVRIPLHRKFHRIHLLQTLLNRGMRQNGVAVKLVFRYADGTYAAVYPRNGVDVAYGQVPVFYNDGEATFRPDEVGFPQDIPSFQRNHLNSVTWKTPKGECCRVWSFTWQNPHPEKELDHLLLEAQDQSTTYCLMALTGEDW